MPPLTLRLVEPGPLWDNCSAMRSRSRSRLCLASTNNLAASASSLPAFSAALFATRCLSFFVSVSGALDCPGDGDVMADDD